MKVKIIKENNNLNEDITLEQFDAMLQALEALKNLLAYGVIGGNAAFWLGELVKYLQKKVNKRDTRFDKTLKALEK
jgi:predicted nucleotide-binding protein (sugar kinase/HSP70/actin superfamily)